jgi:hypothetical protein
MRPTKRRAMETRERARFAVVITRDTLEDWTIYVTANSREDACEQADVIVSNCQFPEFEIIESDYHFDANPIDAWHHAEPSRLDVGGEMVCRLCLNTVQWTGMAVDDPRNRTRKTIPGPWIHARPRTHEGPPATTD